VKREGDIDSVDVSCSCPLDLDPRDCGIDRAALASGRMLNRLAQKASGSRLSLGIDLLPAAFGNDFASINTCSRAEIDDVVGGTHGVLVMFDDEEGVSAVAEVLQNFE
jgi:hypothetical protein